MHPKRKGKNRERLPVFDSPENEATRSEKGQHCWTSQQWHSLALNQHPLVQRVIGYPALALQQFPYLHRQFSDGNFRYPNSQILKSNAQGEAEECFLKAIDIAHQQQAKALELRAAMSLVRLRQRQALEQGARSTEPGPKNETARKPGRVEVRRPDWRPRLPAAQRSSFRLREQEARARLVEAHRMLSEVYN